MKNTKNLFKLMMSVAACAMTTTSNGQVNGRADGIDSQPVFQAYVALIFFAVIFFIIIIGLYRIHVSMNKLCKIETQSSSKNKGLITTLLILIANWMTAQPTSKVEMANSPGTINSYNELIAFIVLEIFTIILLIHSIRKKNKQLALEVFHISESESTLGHWWSDLDNKYFTKATPLEKEAGILMDHDYDGIKELDNALPPWWKYGFYATIVVAFLYLMNFHVWHYGKNPTEEYLAEMESARIQKAEYDALNKDKIDEEHVPMANADGIAIGKEIFHRPAMCSTCHGQAGEGGAGPNLTDDYWIHKGSLNDIFHSIKNGYPDKGMQSWQKSFTPKEISYLASYIKTLRGTNPPNAQPPKGELYIDNSADTASNVHNDSTAIAMNPSKSK